MTPTGELDQHRLRALREAFVLAALLVAGVFAERARGALETHYLAFGCLVLGSLFRRLLAVAGRAPPVSIDVLALELASFSGLVVFPFGRFGLALAALASIALAIPRGDPEAPRAARLDEAAVAALALGALLLGAFSARAKGPALVFAALLSLEAWWGPDAPRTGAAASRRVAAFALVFALALVRGYEKDAEGPIAEELLFFGAATATAATTIGARARLGRPPGLVAAVTIAAWTLYHPHLATILARGSAATWAFVSVHAALLLFALALALSRAPRPGKAALGVALLVSSFVAAEGALMARVALDQRDEPEPVHPFAAPLVAIGQRELIAPGDARRRDFRDLWFDPRKPASTYRIVLLGGSSAWGAFQRWREQSPAGQIEAGLARARPSLHPRYVLPAVATPPISRRLSSDGA